MKLSDRVEKLAGPDREVDCRIYAAISGIPFDVAVACAPIEIWVAPRYTASLDADMSLMPEGWRLDALSESETGQCIARVIERLTDEQKVAASHGEIIKIENRMGWGAELQFAALAAILRARGL